MEDLIPDMKEKIADMRDMKSEAQKKIAEIVCSTDIQRCHDLYRITGVCGLAYLRLVC